MRLCLTICAALVLVASWAGADAAQAQCVPWVCGNPYGSAKLSKPAHHHRYKHKVRPSAAGKAKAAEMYMRY